MPYPTPKYEQHRTVVSAVDSAAPTNKNEGVNFAGFDTALIQVVPTGTADPSVEVMIWSEAAQSFISSAPKLEFSGLGADKAYEISVPAHGRILWVGVTALTIGSLTLHVSGRQTGAL